MKRSTRESRPSAAPEPRRAGASIATQRDAAVPRLGAVLRAALPGLVLATALLVPFLGKAHTIDDVTFLLQARHVLADPLHPTAFDMVADGHRIRLSAAMVSGPLMAWLLAPVAALGGAEWAAHLLQLALVLLAVVATAALALRLGRSAGEARLAALILAATPAAAVLATTSMADVPAMAFAALGIERWLAFRATSRARAGVIATLALAAAGRARPPALALLPVAALAVLPAVPADERRGRDGRAWWVEALPLAAALMTVLLVNRLTADPGSAGGDFASRTAARFEWKNVRPNLVAWGAHWSLAMPLGLAWLLGRGVFVTLRPALWAGLVLAAVLIGLPRVAAYPWALPVVALGFACVADSLVAAILARDRDRALLAAWLLIGLPAAGYNQLPAKVLVVSAPAAALLAARALAGSAAGLRRLAAGAVIAGGAAL
ncbi:MAG TPA: glycosyltransferase family 39 protein, partial [Candidatus Eisenbacteria bacterium]